MKSRHVERLEARRRPLRPRPLTGSAMDVLTFITLTLTGFVACAEFGSYAFVHPVLRHLPATERIRVEQGLLKTFGRVMPVGMTLSLVLSIAFARASDEPLWAWAAVAAFAAALVSTLVFNVPVNLVTGRWDADHPPPDGSRPAPGGSGSRECDPGCSSPASSSCALRPPRERSGRSDCGDDLNHCLRSG